MNNQQVATIFLRIADMLEVKDENVFKIRAYRTAAQNVMNLPRALHDVYTEGPDNIGDIPGIGKDLKEKIIEMMATGGLKYYDDLMKEFKPGFLDLLDIAGLGPKKLKKLRAELGVESMNDLEKVCKNGKLAALEGMGEKTQDKLLDGISHFREREGRMLLTVADAWADEIIDHLKASKLFKKIEKAGSLRRGRETVGDIDILTAAKDVEKAMDLFVNYSNVENIIARGKTKSSISIKEGPQVDLRVVDDKCFGAAHVYFTGSQQHNIKLRQIAKKKNWKVSEYGVFSISKAGRETMIAGKTEEDLYKKLGMEWIPPELRENRGEIEAALENRIPEDLIDMKSIKGDLHLHTDETDGKSSLEEIIEKAKSKGHKYIAITNHSQLVRIANGMDEKRLMKHIEAVRKAASKEKNIKIIVGAEVDMLGDGTLDYPDTVLKELDVVIAAIHSQFTLDLEKQTGRVLRALDNKYVNFLAHPSGRLITTRKPLQLDFDRIFKKAAENNVFLEINTHGERIDLNDNNCIRAKELGARFVINTDAHEAAQMDKMKYGVMTARRAWLEKKDVLNTYSFAKMMKELCKL